MYFNTLARATVLSCQKFAPWASFHFHLFDATTGDLNWCYRNNISVTVEHTPADYLTSPEDSKGFWSNARFMRIGELYHDSTKVMSIDADSLFVKPISQDQFESDLEHSWVTVAAKREFQSLASAVGFGPDSARHIMAKKLFKAPKLTWYLDQTVLDEMIDAGEINTFDTRYSDYKMNDTSYIWTGKGNRKYKQKFVEQSNLYNAKK